MKAVVYSRYGPPEVLRLQEVAKPIPKDDEVLVRVRATTVTAVDRFYRQGSPFIARIDSGLVGPKNPILGTELAGEVEAVGPGVTRFAVGDRVFASAASGSGTYAEYVCLPEGGALAPMPAGLSFEEAAAVPYGALTALHFLRDAAELERGQRVLINGASGSVGSYAVQLARHFGAHVTGVCSGANLELVMSLGADAVVDYTQEDFTHSGARYDVIFDVVGKRSFARCRRSLTPRGLYLTTVPTPAILVQMLWTSRVGSKRAKIAFAGLRPPADKAADLAFLGALIEAGEIGVVVDRCYPLERTAAAHRYVETGRKQGNVVVALDPSRG